MHSRGDEGERALSCEMDGIIIYIAVLGIIGEKLGDAVHKATLTIFFGPRIQAGVFQPCRRKKNIYIYI